MVKDALRDASPLVFNLTRMALAMACLLLVNWRSLRHADRRLWLSGAAAGIFLAAGYQFQTLGLARTTAAKSAFITGLVVVLVPLLSSIPMFRLPATPAPITAVGTFLAFAGLLLLTTPPGTALPHLFSSIGAGDLLILCCALAFAGHLLTLARVPTHSNAGMLATVQIGTATFVMLLTLPLEAPHHFTFTVRLLAALLLTSLLGTAAAFTIQSFAQQHLPATHTAVLLTLEPVFAWLTSTLVLHERLSARAVLGAMLILAGILLIELLGRSAQITEIPA